MSGRIFDHDGDIFFNPDGDYTQKLGDENFIAYLHREEPLYDLVQIQDERDEEWWSWWRFSASEKEFKALVDIAERVGYVVLMNTAGDNTLEAFHRRHGHDQLTHTDLVALTDEEAQLFTDGDFEQLLGDV